MPAFARHPLSVLIVMLCSLALSVGAALVPTDAARAATSPFAGTYTGRVNGAEAILEVSAAGEVTYFNAQYSFHCNGMWTLNSAYWDTRVPVDASGKFAKKLADESLSGTISSTGEAKVYYKSFYLGCAGDVGVTLTRTGPAPGPETRRIAGKNRYETAIAVSRSGYPTTAKVVYLATGADYPDALAAAPAASKQGGPLLLTSSASLPTKVAEEIRRLDPAKVVVVGGTEAVSAETFNQVKGIVDNTVRVSGKNRYETARKIARSAFASSPVAYVATGADYPDALSASAPAGAAGAPVILVRGGSSALDRDTKELLTRLQVKRTVIAGGTSVVSSAIERDLAAFAPTRVAGSNRYDTSRLLNKQLVGAASTAYVATGRGFPDALAGAAVAGAKRAPLYVVRPTCVPKDTRSDILGGSVSRVNLLGGTSALTQDVMRLASC